MADRRSLGGGWSGLSDSTRSRSRSVASASRAGKSAVARILPLPRRLVPEVTVSRTRGCNDTGHSHTTDRADRRRRDSSLRPTSGFAPQRHAQKSAPDRARDRSAVSHGRGLARMLGGGTVSRAASRLSQTGRFTKNDAERGASRRSDRRSHPALDEPGC
jgi:hypothetical protein